MKSRKKMKKAGAWPLAVTKESLRLKPVYGATLSLHADLESNAQGIGGGTLARLGSEESRLYTLGQRRSAP
jgi:hypothetical protein